MPGSDRISPDQALIRGERSDRTGMTYPVQEQPNEHEACFGLACGELSPKWRLTLLADSKVTFRYRGRSEQCRKKLGAPRESASTGTSRRASNREAEARQLRRRSLPERSTRSGQGPVSRVPPVARQQRTFPRPGAAVFVRIAVPVGEPIGNSTKRLGVRTSRVVREWTKRPSSTRSRDSGTNVARPRLLSIRETERAQSISLLVTA